jgi:methionyl-tRNA formyltransferase
MSMFNTVILLTGPAEQPTLSALLRQHNPHLNIHVVATLAELEAIKPSALRRARLIAFVTPVVVPKHMIDQLGFGAYNFHPGPPHYPGWLPAYLAVYERARTFGATAHVMTERVDAGPIVDVELFNIPPTISAAALEQRAFAEAARLFWRLAHMLSQQSKPLSELPIRWTGRKSTKRLYAALCEIPPDIAPDDLQRRIAAFGSGACGNSPAVTLHGQRFSYMAEREETTDAPSVVPEASLGEPMRGPVGELGARACRRASATSP